MAQKRWCDRHKGFKDFFKQGYLSLKSNVRICNGCDCKLNIKVYSNKIDL